MRIGLSFLKPFFLLSLLVIISCSKEEKVEMKQEKAKIEDVQPKLTNISDFVSKQDKDTRTDNWWNGWIDQINGKQTVNDSTYNLTSNSISLVGWAIDCIASQLAASVMIQIGDKQFPVNYGLKRSDIQKTYGEALLYSGFFANINSSDLPKGKNKVILKVLSNDKNSIYTISKQNFYINKQ